MRSAFISMRLIVHVPHRGGFLASSSPAERKREPVLPFGAAPAYAGSGGRDMGARGGRTTEPVDKQSLCVNVPLGPKNTQMFTADVVAIRFT